MGYDVLHILFKRKRVILLAFALILGPALISTALQPSVYRAASRLMITQVRAYPQLSPKEEPRNVPVNDVQLVAAAAQKLRTNAFLREAAEALVKTAPAENGAGGSAAWWQSRLMQRLEVTPLSNAPVIEVAYRAADAERAAHVVNTVVQQYVRYEAHTVFDNPALRQFYERRRDDLRKELLVAEATLTGFQDEHRVFDLTTQREQLTRAHTQALESLDLNDGQIRQAAQGAKSLSAQLEKLPAQVALHTYGDSPRVGALSAKVVELELKLNGLRQLYTDEDRRVSDTLDELARAEDLLLAEEASAGSNPTMTRLESNDAYQNILENALREEASAEALRARRGSIENAVTLTAERLQGLNRISYEFERLQGDVTARKNSYTQILALLEQARTSEAMDDEGLTNVRIVDRASAPPLPLPSRRWLTLAMGVLASVAVGIGGAFSLEAFAPTVHGTLDGEERLALPVLGIIPEDS